MCLRPDTKAAPRRRERRQPGHTEYSLRNSAIGVAGKSAAIAGGYVTRIVLVRCVSTELVGANGFCTSLLGGLSLASIGIETAMAYALFAPVATGDLEQQRALLRLYKRIYLAFSAVIALLGAGLYPFLPALIQGDTDMAGVGPVYWLFLLNTVLSYQWAYKGLLLFVSQKNYINELFSTVFWTAQYALQCAALALTRDITLYLAAAAACTLCRNLCVSAYVGERYPAARGSAGAGLEPGKKRTILRDLRAILVRKSGYMLIESSGHLLISALFGFTAVAAYSNYTLISGSVSQLFNRLVGGTGASVGDLGVTETREHVGRVFDVVLFVTCWIFGFGAISLLFLLDPFVRLSFGERFLLPRPVTAVLCLNFYLYGVRRAAIVFRDSLGLFWKDRYVTVGEGAILLAASLLLSKRLGMTGILLGATVSIVALPLWTEPLLLYRDYLGIPLRGYFVSLLRHSLRVCAGGAAVWALCRNVHGGALTELLLRGCICAVMPNAAILALSWRSRELLALRHKLLSLLRRPSGG